jgi:hypothetical protein
MQAKKAPALLILKTYDEPVVAFEGSFDEASIAAFVEAKSAPLLPEMDQEPRNKKALSRVFSDQATPKLLAVVAEVFPPAPSYIADSVVVMPSCWPSLLRRARPSSQLMCVRYS